MSGRSSILTLAFLVLTLAPASADVEPAPKADEKPPEVAAPQKGGSLRWWNGETLLGDLTSSQVNTISWSSPHFERAAKIETSQLYDIRFQGKPEETLNSPIVVSLRNGSRMLGTLVSLDQDYLGLDADKLGKILIKREQLSRIDRLTGSGILWSGPQGRQDWTQEAKKHNNTDLPPGWINSQEGLRAVSVNRGLTIPIDTKEAVEIAFDLSTEKAAPAFSLSIHNDGNYFESISVWDDTVVLHRGSHFVPLLTLKKTDRHLALSIRIDPKKAGGTILSDAGEVLARWQNGETEPAPDGATVFPLGDADSGYQGSLAALELINSGPDLCLRHLRIRKINSIEPPKFETPDAAGSMQLETADGKRFSGELQSMAEGKLHLQVADKPQTFPVSKLLSVVFSAQTEADDDAEIEHPQTWVDLALWNGTKIQGTLGGMKEDRLTVRSPNTKTPILVPTTSLQQITWPNPPNELLATESMDTLKLAGTTLRGHWEPKPGGQIHWRPAGAKAAVPLVHKPTSRFTLTRSEVATQPEPTAEREAAEKVITPTTTLLHLSDGQILPCKLVSIAKDGGITIDSKSVSNHQLAPDLVRAIQFPREQVETQGFGDPGWRFVLGKRDSKSFQEKSNGTVVIDPSHSWGHSSILVGSEFSFETKRLSGHGGIKIGIFGNGVDHDIDATYLLLADWGSRIYHGISSAQGDFLGNYQQHTVDEKKANLITLRWDDNKLDYFINDVKVGTITTGKKAPRSGIGLLFESASIWGNDPGQNSISNFSIVPDPSSAWVPNVAAQARERALYLPRYRKDDPPKHVLIARNGDVLSGTIEAATETQLRVRSRLETFDIPRERAAAAIWVHPPVDQPDGETVDVPDAENKDDSAEEKEEQPSATAAGKHWILLRGGGRISMTLSAFADEFALGQSAILGNCKIPVEQIYSISSDRPDVSAASVALSGWQLEHAPQPMPEGAAPGQSDSPLIGKPAPDFELFLLDGSKITLKEERGKVIVLDFWATWCGPCVKGMPEMMAAFAQFDTDTVRLVAANQAEQQKTIKEFLKTRGWDKLTVGLDSDQAVGLAFGVEGIPMVIVIDTDGNVAAVKSGYTPGAAQQLADQVKTILSKAIRIN